jgi:serine/threonine protein kinase
LWGNCYIPPRGHSTVLDERLLDERFSFKHESRQFQYNELANATANFSNLKMIGKGGFGPVYKGTLKLNGLDTEVAIKRMGEYSKQGIKEYVAEVNIIRHAKHQNLVKLIGWCHDREELLLVYELMANGSLDKHLHSEKDVFSWKKRYAVILGVGSALQYLHEGLHLPVLHRDIKPANVMLDDSFTAKLGDFGLARFVNHGDRLDNTIMAGTLGYMDPKCFQTQSVTAESDVYSFGVLLLEMACGKKPAVKTDQDEEAVVHISQWVLDMYSQGMDFNAVADPRLDGEFMDKQMEAVLDVGLWCVHGTPKRRPSARQAVNALRLDAELPRLREPADSDSMLRFEAQIWRASVKRKKVHDESDTKMGDVELDTITHGLRGPSEWKPAPIPKTENVYYGKENIGRKVQSETNEIETDTYGVYETAHSEMLEKDCITTSEWAELEEIIKCVNKTKETVNMVHIEDLIVKQKDLKCLTNPYLDNEKDKYLGDEVIDCFIEHHRRSTPSDIRKGGTVFVERVLNTYALQNDVRRNTGVQLAMGGSRKGIDYLRNNMIYLPIHDADHWYLVVVNTTIQHIQILNSLSHEGIQNEASCMYLHNTLMGMESDIRFALDQGGEEICTWSQRNFCVASWPRKVIRNVPLQRDGSSCGLYLIMNIINWTGRELAQQFDQATINKFRPELALILIKSPHNKLHKEPNKDKDDN